jgi:hypothetical protein
MTDNNHPITPPPELVQQWIAKWSLGGSWSQVCQNIALVAARWGADQELEACCEWLHSSLPGYDKHYADYLRAARRPKPPSLKEQALALISHDPENQPFLSEKGIAIIRRALESLPD